MKYIKYFLQFLFISFLLIFFKIIGLKFSRIISSKLFSIFGPFFRSKKLLKRIFHLHFMNLIKNLKELLLKACGKVMGKF